jgi:Domain of unknown function (DUF1707)
VGDGSTTGWESSAVSRGDLAQDPTGGSPYTAADSGTVTDEDRTRYGVLLDRAAERGLLAPYDYEMRLRDVASATTIEQMNRIVTELPVFTGPAGATPRNRRRPVDPLISSNRPSFSAAAGPRRARLWLMVTIVMVVAVASLLFLSIYTRHLVHNRNSGLPAITQPVSGLRL